MIGTRGLVLALALASALASGCTGAPDGGGDDDDDDDGQSLDAPSGLSADPGNASMTLQWSAVDGATGYHVYLSTSPIGDVTALTPVAVAAPEHIATGLENWVVWHVRVTAIDASRESAPSEEVSAETGAGWVILTTVTAGTVSVSRFHADALDAAIDTTPGITATADEVLDDDGARAAVVYRAGPDAYEYHVAELGLFAPGRVILGNDASRRYRFERALVTPAGLRVIYRDWSAALTSYVVRASTVDGVAEDLATCDAVWNGPVGDPFYGERFQLVTGEEGAVFTCRQGGSDDLWFFDGTTTVKLPGVSGRAAYAIRAGRVFVQHPQPDHRITSQLLSGAFAETLLSFSGAPHSFGGVNDEGTVVYYGCATVPNPAGEDCGLLTVEADGTNQTGRLDSEGYFQVTDIAADGSRFTVVAQNQEQATNPSDTKDRAWSVPFEAAFGPVQLFGTGGPTNDASDARVLPGAEGYLGYWSVSGWVRVGLDGTTTNALAPPGDQLLGITGDLAIFRSPAGSLYSKSFDGAGTHALSAAAAYDSVEIQPDGLLTFVDDETAWVATPDGALLDEVEAAPATGVSVAGREGGRLFLVLERETGHRDVVVYDIATGAVETIADTTRDETAAFLPM